MAESNSVSNPMISVQNITRSFGPLMALNDLSFEVEAGEIFGLIGPDGAGKTTLFRIMATLLLADQGKITLDGLDAVEDFRTIRKHIGYMPGRFSLYQDLTVEENLSFFATVFNTSIKENYHLIKDIYVQIEPFKKRRAGALSGGMKQKLALCCALIHFPKILLLDEPTTGVDPVSRAEFWHMLGSLRNNGITIVVSTPYMDEAGRCNRIALMQQGSFLKMDTPDQITAQYDRTLMSVRSDSMYPLLKDLREIPEIISCFAFGDSHHISFDQTGLKSERIVEFLKKKGHKNIDLSPIEAGIEDCFMDLSGPGEQT
ncbi:ABC transporter ATP-binding protein [Oceanispirochaeta sp.]|jgi:ABC-2 type transport system ATP-binding protein|uniref:ABC transporter ATP-binding protein n=1 Tax=Oceanispirochaeta sp. TaxID=2035350 RepID=UPI002605E465|nr:ABC transporter ATP-binding protein [Oceanispirochaeta sp.]MDA3955529.1 ABC transporter ATP-binding protein [Oceanispirochaeta sp.]